MQRVSGLSVLAAAIMALILLGCGGGDDGEAGPAADERASTPAGSSARPGASSPTGAGSCEATVSGGVTATIKSGGGVMAVNSDYWFTEAELIQGAQFLDETEEEVRAKIAAKQFVFYAFVLNCGDSKTGINFLPNAETHGDFPFGPKTYRIPAGDALGGEARNGEVSVLVTINEVAFKSNGGTFEVKKFDKTGVAGTFSIDVEEWLPESGPAKSAKVTGTFDMPCTGGATRGGCAR